MSDFSDFVQSVVQHPLIVIRFTIDQDLSMVFHAIEHETTGAFIGVGLTPVRRSKGAHFIRLNSELLTNVFSPVVTPVGKEWLMKVNPLTEDIRIQKRPNSKYTCFYPFKKQGCNGLIKEVWVDGTRSPNMKLWFNIHASFQPAKDAPKQHLECRVDCSDGFTKRLFQLTVSPADGESVQ